MPEIGDAEAIITAAQNSVDPYAAEDGVNFYLARDDDGDPIVIDMIEHRGKHQMHPARIIGHAQVTTGESFKQYVLRHKTDELEIWAEEQTASITAVFDSHSDLAGWGQHRATLNLQRTTDWQTWAGQSGKMTRQTDFAEFIEDNVENIVTPSSADMLELAQNFQATTGGTFESSKFLDSGHRQLVYKETVEASAGRRGQLDIPNTFELALQPFVGLDVYKVRARFRYRINDGNLLLGYKLDRPDDVLRTAFNDTVDSLADDLGLPILAGRSW